MPELSRRSFLASTTGLIAATSCAAPAVRRATGSTRFERDRFIEDVKLARPEGQAAVEDVIARAVSEPGTVIADLGPPEKAAITLLYRDADLSIFNIVWPPFTVLVPHDHLMWASIGVYTGREDNVMWRRRDGSLEAETATSVATRDVFSLPHEAIHSVINPVGSYTAAIHVYGGDLSAARRSQWDAQTLSEAPFDVEAGRRILAQFDERWTASNG